jgi:hypothetical protein
MATKFGLGVSQRFLQDVAANGGQSADLENSGRLFRSRQMQSASARGGQLVVRTHNEPLTVARSKEKLTAFLELERVTRESLRFLNAE